MKLLPALPLVMLVACSSTANAPSPAVPAPPPSPRASAEPAPPARAVPAVADPYLWLEAIDSKASLAWAKAQDAKSEGELEAVPGFQAAEARLKSILDSQAKIPYVQYRKGFLYNFWQDDAHLRGVWRRTTLAEYKKAAPRWETLLDLDALNTTEKASWVYKGASCLYPKYERCLVSLSRGGADATVVREFDVTKQAFVDGGFTVPEAKNQVAWRDADTVYVGTDFGPGSMTSSGYPRIAKAWKRGTPLSSATTIYEGKATDVAVIAYRQWDHGKTYDFVERSPSFFSGETYSLASGTPVKLDKPDDASIAYWDDQVMITLREAWTVGGKTYPAGALLVEGAADYAAGKRDFGFLFTPQATTALEAVTPTKHVIYVTELQDVHDQLYQWQRTGTGKTRKWVRTAIQVPALAAFSVSAWDEDTSDDYWRIDSNFLTPTSLALVTGGKQSVLKRTPAFFDATGLDVQQHFVTSKDGTKVPYFQVGRKDLPLDGSTPVMIRGYGGFEVSETPGYEGTTGAMWLERGAVLVIPNLRGGGEYGPTWHTQAIKANRQRVYDDFAAVAEDLIARKVTSPAKLGILGGSNGGLLVGVMMTERPELFGAVVCQAPLLDMKRYHLLLAGASWMEEYGNPDVPEEWAWISKYSPYQNVKPNVTYPRVLFTTSTRDDRVHPGHARKMAARMIEQGHDVLFYENLEGGHSGAADAAQRAHVSALAYAFLWKQLGVAPAH